MQKFLSSNNGSLSATDMLSAPKMVQKELIPHRRQFVLGFRPILPDSSWLSMDIGRERVLSYSQALPVLAVTGPDGEHRVLLGIVYSVDEEDPADIIRSADSESLLERTKSWTGRWVLIAGDRLFPDVGGILGCFYASAADGQLWVSSSPALIAEAGGFPATPGLRDPGWGKGIDWCPPPQSRISGVRRLLPSETLDLASGRRVFRNVLAIRERPYSEILDDLSGHLTQVIRRAAVVAPRVWVPLTGGYDSRLLLAAAKAARVDVVAVTQKKNDMSLPDRELPPLLAETAGVEHLWIPVGEEREELYGLYDQHTAGHIMGADRKYFAREQLDWAEPDDLILRGGAFEIGRCFYWRKLESEFQGIEALARGLKVPSGDPFLSGMKEWLRHCEACPMPGIDWRDRLYLEQRVGGWLSSVEQSLDLLPGVRFHVANSAKFIGEVLSIPAKRRIRSRHQVDMVDRLCPRLNRFPYNRRAGVGGWLKERLSAVRYEYFAGLT